jgi:REP element-mobilizing transposase RayT
MARPLRIEFSGALYHVMSRGNEQEPIVRDEVDREKRLDWLRRTVETYGWRLHALVLKGNHEHLFVETLQPNLSAGMRYLNGSYTSCFNRRHHRSGHLLQGRFKAHLIETQGCFLQVSRYIHLNPVWASNVAAHFGHDARGWRPGPRVNDASRVVAACLARWRFGYAAREVAAALGYHGHGGVHNAVASIETGPPKLGQTAEELWRQLR